jgi:hypothetical protein
MLTRLRILAFQRGVTGNSRAFLGIWLLITGFRLLKRLLADEPQVVYREELKPGEHLVIDHLTVTRG